MGKVGDDPFGHFLARTLEVAGVDTGPLCFSSEARTALAFVSLRADGDREFTFYRHPSADMLFTPEEVDARALRAAKALHYGSISLIGEPSRSATLHAIAIALENGLLLSCDPNLRPALWVDLDAARAGLRDPNLRPALWVDLDAARAGLRLAMEHAQIVKLSDDEVAFLVGDADPLLARERLWTERTELMVITRGAAGCIWLTREHAGEVAGFPVEAVDTTGAGDGFVAGLLHGLVRDRAAIAYPDRLRELCRFACAVGALATTQRGAIPALPTLARVERFLEEQGYRGPGDGTRLADGDLT